MWDEFGAVDPDEILLIDADPLAFGPLPAPPEGEPAGPEGTSHRRWLPVAAVAALVAILAATLVVWRPWTGDDGTLALPSGDADTATLSERLVLADATSEVTEASLGAPPSATGNRLFEQGNALGDFFAAPGAMFGVNGAARGRWAGFFAEPTTNADAPPVSAVADGAVSSVRGATAVFTPIGDGADSWQIDFGPLHGYGFSLVTVGMTRDESAALAEAIDVEDGVALVTDRKSLLDMQPVGSLQAYAAFAKLMLNSDGHSFLYSDLVAVRYGSGEDGYIVTSVEVTDDRWLEMAAFMLGVAPDRRVHSFPAVATIGRLDGFGAAGRAVVAWVEGGRLVVVTGSSDVDATVAIVEHVRVATDQEWAKVATVAATTGSGSDEE